MKVVVAKDYREICKLVSRIFAAQVTLKPDSVLGLATGSTPVGMYQELVQMYQEGRIDFSHVRTVNLDEYAGLSGDNDQSYRYFMNHNLFDHINIDKANTHVPCGIGADHEADAKAYDAAVEAADVVLMDDDPLKISKAIKISRKCIRIVYENIIFALGVKFSCLLLVALGAADMGAAIFADVGVMVIAVLNAMRALRANA